MSVEYLRKCSLIVGNSDQALEIGALHVKFHVAHNIFPTPDILTCRIYNLKPATTQLITNEFQYVQLSAGYVEGQYGIIFVGEIVFRKTGHESPVDSFLDLTAADGDAAHTYGVINHTLASGYGQADTLSVIQSAYAGYGVLPGSQGSTPTMQNTKMPRGRAFFGDAKDYLADYGKMNGVYSYICDGMLETVGQYDVVPTTYTVLNSTTGLIGWPQQTMNGLQCRCLLNPSLRQNRMIRINNADVVALSPSNWDPTQIGNFVQTTPSLSVDGFYKIYAADFDGDTRGTPWYTDLWCVTPTDRLPQGGVPLTSQEFLNVPGANANEPPAFQRDNNLGNPNTAQPVPIPVPTIWKV